MLEASAFNHLLAEIGHFNILKYKNLFSQADQEGSYMWVTVKA